MVYGLAAFGRIGSKVLMPLLGCEGVFSLQLRCGFSGEEWDRYECVLTNEWGLGLLSVLQDGGADPFGWQSMVALQDPWGHAGRERCETLRMKQIQTFTNSKI